MTYNNKNTYNLLICNKENGNTMKRIAAIILAFAMAVSLMPDAMAEEAVEDQYESGRFTDVEPGSALEENIKTACDLGLMQGKTDDMFGPADSLTCTAALIIACRVNSRILTGKDTIEQDYTGETRTELYRAYAADHGIFCEINSFTGFVTRAEFAAMLQSALPADKLTEKNTVEDGAIPDVAMEDQYSAAIYTLYRAGVLTGGNEYGTFSPNALITRRAACAIASRMADSTLRRELTLNEETKAAYEAHLERLAAEKAEQERLNAAIAMVRTINVEATVLYDTNIYSTLSLGGYVGRVKAGTTVIYDNYSGTYAARIRTPDGVKGWVPYSAIRISTRNFVSQYDFTTEQKEGFVNRQGYKSKTDYLIWVSLATQQVVVYQGAQGNWKEIRTFDCCSGKNSTPTIAGVFEIYYKQNAWDFGSYYVATVVGFNGGHAFHTRTYVKGTGGLLDPTIGSPASHGCIRMYDADVAWVSNNMPFGTTVVVY